MGNNSLRDVHYSIEQNGMERNIKHGIEQNLLITKLCLVETRHENA